MTLQMLIVGYAAFAVLATTANLATQRIVLMAGGTSIQFVAMAGGTVVRLFIKYLLDKRCIFYDRGSGFKDHGQKVSVYSAMGLLTTAIFWGTETLFLWIWQTDLLREVGAVVGLSIGYLVKYNLDRRYVFTDAQSEAAA